MQGQLQEQRTTGEGGFTLIELLVVIIILGILAAVVVFAVGGIGDKGQNAACKIDTRTLRTAEEAYAAQPAPAGNGSYGTMQQLKDGGFLSDLSSWHDVTPVPDDPATPANETSVTITVTGAGIGRCGAGGPVGQGDNI